MLNVIWLEGLPGAGKSTIIELLGKDYKRQLLVFPKTDLISIFYKGFNFPFNKYCDVNYDSAIATEFLKASLLNTWKDDSITVIGERSYVSSIVYYTALYNKSLFSNKNLQILLNSFSSMQKNYKEHFLYIDTTPEISLKFDKHNITSFWSSADNCSLVRSAYFDFFKKNDKSSCIIKRDTLEDVKRNSKCFVEEIING
jgi:thymidylate kinase